MPRRAATIVSSGRNYRLGRTEEYGAIWRKRPWGWRIVARYPLTDEGWHIASARYAMWEPQASPVNSWGPTALHPPGRRWRLLGWPWAVVPAVVLVLAAVGAGLYFGNVVRMTTTASHASSPTTQPPVGSGYLASGSTTVLFLQWTDTAGSLDGSAQLVSTSGSAPTEQTTTETIAVVGRIRGSQITLRFNGGNEQFGTLSSGGFTINFPVRTGALEPVTFHSATTTKYNQAIARLHAKVTSINSAAAHAEQIAKLQTNIDNEAARVNADITTVATDEASLSKAVQAIPAALQDEANSLATTQAGEEHAVAENGTATHGTVCSDVGTVRSDAGTVRSDAGTVKVDIVDIYGVQTAVTALKNAYSKLQSDEAELPGYELPDAPTSTAVQQAESSAASAIAAALSTTNGYIDQANADVTAADQYAQEAAQDTGCGTDNIPWTPIAHIT